MDYRDHEYYPAGVTVDEHSMAIVIDGHSFPAHFIVCPYCDGRGRYVSPSIDSHGISAEEMDELGADFREDYMRGRYDVVCRACKGRRVVLAPATEEGARTLQTAQDEEDDMRSAYEAERRAGA